MKLLKLMGIVLIIIVTILLCSLIFLVGIKWSASVIIATVIIFGVIYAICIGFIILGTTGITDEDIDNFNPNL